MGKMMSVKSVYIIVSNDFFPFKAWTNIDICCSISSALLPRYCHVLNLPDTACKWKRTAEKKNTLGVLHCYGISTLSFLTHKFKVAGKFFIIFMLGSV